MIKDITKNNIPNKTNKHSIDLDIKGRFDYIRNYYKDGTFKIPIHEDIGGKVINDVTINEYFVVHCIPKYEIVLLTNQLFENIWKPIQDELFECGVHPNITYKIISCLQDYSKEIECIIQYFKESGA